MTSFFKVAKPSLRLTEGESVGSGLHPSSLFLPFYFTGVSIREVSRRELIPKNTLLAVLFSFFVLPLSLFKPGRFFPTTQLRYDHSTNLVDEHGLCAANVAACRAFDKLTPSISNRICPVDTRAIQPVGFPFPLPILTSVGFPVIGRSARTLTHILPFLRDCPLIARWKCPIVARRAASIARYERRPALQLLVPYLP